jgi:hypothetical protein
MPQLDYANPDAWSVHPTATGLAPDHLTATATPMADVFYVHPTTYFGPHWNQPADDAAAIDWTDRSVVVPHLDPFTSSCRLFAPRYAQASVRAVREPGPAAEAAWERAYTDVARAFRHYLRHESGRPLILFGHSQGALHVSNLLAEIIEPEGLAPRLVAAYVIGIGLSEGLFGGQNAFYRQLQPCMSPAQTSCVISWNSFLPDADLTLFRARTQARDETRKASASLGLPICINPLSFDAEMPDVTASANPGTLVGTVGELPLLPLQPGLAGAACRDGVLQVFPEPACPLQPLPGGNMHMHDIALFHAALRADAQRRTSAL